MTACANLPINGESKQLKSETYRSILTWKIDKIVGETHQESNRLFLFPVLITYPQLTCDVRLSIVVRHHVDTRTFEPIVYTVTLPKDSLQAVFTCILPEVGQGTNDFDFEMTDDSMHMDTPLKASLSVQSKPVH